MIADYISFISCKKCECVKVHSHKEVYPLSKLSLTARKVIQVDEMIVEEEEEESKNKTLQTARVSKVQLGADETRKYKNK